MTADSSVSPSGHSAPTGHQISVGTGWLLLFKLFDKSIGLVSTLILARVLVPADFGLVAMASAVVAMTELMGAFGFDNALIQRRDSERRFYDTAWTFNVVFGLVVGMLILALTLPAAAYYHEPRLELVLPALALGATIAGFENIGTVAFRRNLDFRSEFRFLLAKRLAPFFITVALAVLYQTYWALVAGMVAGRLMGVAISYALHPYRPRLSLESSRDLMGFSKWLLISNLIQFVHSRSTDFILGRTAGGHALGIYNVGAEIAALPSTELIAPINRAVFPAYSRLTHDIPEMLRRFTSVFSIIAFLSVPVAVGLFCLADLVVALLLGPKWVEAGPVVRISAVTGLAAALQSNMYVFVLALGQPRANTLVSGLVALVSVPLVVVASLSYGIVGAAFAHAAASVVGLLGIMVVFVRLTPMTAAALGAILWRPVVSSVVVALILEGGVTALTGVRSVPPVLALVPLIVLGAVTYLSSSYVVWRLAGRPEGAELDVYRTARSAVVRVFRGKSGP